MIFATRDLALYGPRQATSGPWPKLAEVREGQLYIADESGNMVASNDWAQFNGLWRYVRDLDLPWAKPA